MARQHHGLRRNRRFHENGMALIETALLLPLLLTLAFNTVNFGYFLYVMLNLSTASRQGAQYLTQGPYSLEDEVSVPGTDEINTLVHDNVDSALKNGATATVIVCSSAVGAPDVNHRTQCTAVLAGRPDKYMQFADQEAPTFMAQEVEVTYTVEPLIKGWAFSAVYNLVLPDLTFRRHVMMRSLY